MNRPITDHKLNGLNDAIVITPIGERGKGGAFNSYDVNLVHDGSQGVPSFNVLLGPIEFQSKPIQGPSDFNGLTNEALLAVVIDRLRGFQGVGADQEEAKRAGKLPHEIAPFACRENAIALTHLEEALMWLQKRTRDRMARGVEGSYQK